MALFDLAMQCGDYRSYFHDGSRRTLKEAVHCYVGGTPTPTSTAIFMR